MNIVDVVYKVGLIVLKTEKMMVPGSVSYMVFRSLLFQTATTSSYPVNNLLFINFSYVLI